jgi:serine protease inhibitor
MERKAASMLFVMMIGVVISLYCQPCKTDQECENLSDIPCPTDCMIPKDNSTGVKCISRKLLCKNGRCACDFPTQKEEQSCKEIKEEDIKKGLNDFAVKLFSKIVAEENDKNIFISPLSIAYALGLAYSGSDKNTKEEFEKVLLQKENICSTQTLTDKIGEYFLNMMENITKLDSKVILTIANSIWARQGYNFKESFFDFTKKYYKAQIQTLDFKAPDAADVVNKWVSDNTNDKIKKIIERFTNYDVMLIINAIYFKGIWKYPFKKEETKEGIFYLLNNNTKKVMFMHNTIEHLRYYEDEDVQIVELPYGNEKVSMFIFLPSKKLGLSNFYSKLNEMIDEKLAKVKRFEEVNIAIPRFKMEYEKILNEILKSLGIKEAFSEKANFSKMREQNDIYISEVRHKTFVEVNEEGTEAAAATSIVMTLAAAHPFQADRPFFFLIKDNKTNSILFMGSIVNP